MQFMIPILLLLIAVAALLAYLLKPGHLLPGNIKLECRIVRIEEPEPYLMDGTSVMGSSTVIVEITNISGNALWYDGPFQRCPERIEWEALVNGEWEWVSTRIGTVFEILPNGDQKPLNPSGDRTVFLNGETMAVDIWVREGTEAIKISIPFLSRWFGKKSNYWSDEIKIDPQMIPKRRSAENEERK